jgi:hypothetical protein
MRTLLKVAAIAAAIVLAAMPALVPAVAFAQEATTTSTTVDLSPILTQLSTVFVDIVVGLLGIVGLWLASILKAKWGIDIEAGVRDIEANHRDALHSAVETWTNAAIAKFGPNLKITSDNAVLSFILNGVKSSAPEAIKALQVADSWIISKAAGLAGVTPVIPVAAAP